MTEQREKKRKNIPFKSEQSEGTGILVVQCNALTNDYCQRNKEQKTFQILGPNLIYKRQFIKLCHWLPKVPFFLKMAIFVNLEVPFFI